MLTDQPRRVISRRTFHQSAAAVCAGLATLGNIEPAFSAEWEQFGETDGIKLFKKEEPGTPLLSFRGVALVDAPIEKVIWVLADNEHRTEWVDRLKKSVILERHSLYDFVVYQHFGAPPIVSDRDFVYRARARSRADGAAILEIASVVHPKAPPTAGVRGELKSSTYVLKKSGDKSTLVDVSVSMDPKGSIPNWLVNTIQKSWPKNTLSSLRKQVKKPFVGQLAPPPL